MDKNILQKVKEVLNQKVAEKKAREAQEEQLGWFNALIQSAVEQFGEIIERIQIKAPDVTVNVPEVKLPVFNIPEIQLPTINIPEIKIPEIRVPDIHIPEIKVPQAEVKVTIPPIVVPEPKVTVNVPEIKIPKIEMPDEMNVSGDIAISGWVAEMLGKPLPVQIRDAEGNPVDLMRGLASIGGGGGPRFMKINNTADEPIPITGNISASFSADFGQGETGAETLRVVHATDSILSVNIVAGSSSGATGQGDEASATRVVVAGNSAASVSATQIGTWTVSVSDVFGSVGANVVNPDGRLKVELPTGSSGLTDTELRANSIDVQQASGASWSTNVLSMPDVVVTSITNSTASSLIDSTGVQYSGSNPVPITWVSGAGVSTQVNISDSTGVGYSGSNPLPVTMVTGVSASVNASLIDSGGVGYSGSNPLSVGLVGGGLDSMFIMQARTTNPTVVADGADVRPMADRQGRQVMTPVQVRGLMQTAYVSVSTGTEAVLLAGVSGVFMDLVSITASTTSTFGVTAQVPISVDVRCCRTGGVVLTLPINGLSATNTGTQSFVSKDYTVPLPQDEAGNAWTVDLPDITGTTVTISALFARNT